MKRCSSVGYMAAVTCVLAVVLLAAKKPADIGGSQLAFGVDMAKRGLWSEALFRFKQAERHSPGDPRILNNMAVAYEALGNFEKALDYYQNAIKSDPGNKELKRNYSRFVEFYRSFKPAEKTEESSPSPRAPPEASPSGP